MKHPLDRRGRQPNRVVISNSSVLLSTRGLQAPTNSTNSVLDGATS